VGGFLNTGQARAAAVGLNDQFGPNNIAATFATIEELRKTFPNLLNPMQNPGPKDRRKQTLRFAAFQINDQLIFDQAYPALRYNNWLKWLTWLYTQQGNLSLNGAAFNGTAGDLITQVLAQALPPGGSPSTVEFRYTHDPIVANFSVDATTNPNFLVHVHAPNASQVNGSDEDDV
jgi:hypothetical protein